MLTTPNYLLQQPQANDTVDLVTLETTNTNILDSALTPTADPTQAPAGLSGKLSQWVSWFTNRIKAITGTTNWYDAPPTTLTAANSHMADNTRHVPYVVDTGVVNAYVVTLSPAPTAYVDGMGLSINIANASTGASTINVNGLGVKPILDSLGNAINAGGLKAGIIYTLRYNATTGNFIVQGKGGGGNATAADLAMGKTATVDSGQITGSATDRRGSGLIITPSNVDQAVPGGIYGGTTSDGKVAAVSFDASKLLTGTTVANTAGTMPENGALGATLTTPGATYTIPSGHTTGGTVSVSMTTKSAQTYTPGTSAQTIASGQYLSGTQTISGDANLIASNILSGASIFGVAGSVQPRLYATGSVSVSSTTQSWGSGVEAGGSYPITVKTVTVSGLTFQPNFIEVVDSNGNYTLYSVNGLPHSPEPVIAVNTYNQSPVIVYGSPIALSSSGFTFPINNSTYAGSTATYWCYY